MSNDKKDEIISQEDIKRRKSAVIRVFPEMNIFNKNLNNSGQSAEQLTRSPPLKFKSNSLFAYQEIDKFSSFCDNESFPLDILSYLNENQNSNKNNQNINANNGSTKHEEYEESDSSSDDSINNEMSDDEIIFKKYKHRMEKRKSALNSVPLSFKALQSVKPNELSSNKINDLGSGKKINKNTVIPNNFINTNNNYMIHNNKPNNCRRSSCSINPIPNNLFFNNILNNNQQNTFNQFLFPQNIIENSLSDNFNSGINANSLSNNSINNSNNNITNSPIQINLAQRYPNNTNFNNYNYINNFPFNFYNNKIQDTGTKKRNSMIMLTPSDILVQRRSSHTSIPNIQLINSDKKLQKIETEENPDYFLKDQLYCRQIQNKLDKNINNLKYSDEFYDNIKFKLIEIIEHQFGNYVMQKFLTNLLIQENKNLFKIIFIEIKDKLFEICINNYGTRVIQKMLEKLDNGYYYKIETPELNDVIKHLIENHLYELCCDKNGNHVYQKLLRVFPKERNQFLYDYLIKISFQVSIIQQGATLIQTALDFSSKDQQEKLCHAILEKIGDLINDKYGNYTIQTIFKLFNDEINDKIYDYIDKNIVKLSKEKFSSNVIDKCIIKNYDKSNRLIESIIKKNIIKEIIVDQYGNYVVQKALNISGKEVCSKIIRQIKPILGDLQKTNIGKKIYEKLNQNYKEYFI